MPFFEYLCADCDEVFEKLLPRREADATQVCPQCSGERTRRVLSTFAVKTRGGESGGEGGCAVADRCPSASFN